MFSRPTQGCSNERKVMTKTAAILGALNAVLVLLLAFGVSVSDAQIAAIMTFANAVLVLGAALLDPNVPFGKTDPAE